MKPYRILLLVAFLSFCVRLWAATNNVSAELLTYNLKTSVEAYDKVGRKNTNWDPQAKNCLRIFAEIRSTTNGNAAGLLEQIKTNLSTVVALKCDDPFIRYLHTRDVLGATRSASQPMPVFADVASAFEQTQYPGIRKFYARMWVYRTAAETGTEKNTSALLEKAAPFLAEALQDKTMPVREGTTGCEELMSPPLVV